MVIFSVDIGLYPGYFGKDNRCDSVCSRNALTWKNFLSLQCHTESGGPSDGAQNFGQFLGLSGRRQKEEVAKGKDVKFYNWKTNHVFIKQSQGGLVNKGVEL